MLEYIDIKVVKLMNDYIENIGFKGKQKKSYQIVLIIIIITLFATLIIRSCSEIYDDKNSIDSISDSKEKYDMDKPFRQLGIYSQSQLDEYLHEVSKHLEPRELQNLIDWDDTKYYKYRGVNWDVYESGWEILEQKFEWPTHDELIRRVVYKGYDWSVLPLSEKFREKFKGVSIPEYYGFTDNRVYRGSNEYKWIMLDIYSNGKTFSFEELTGNGDEANDVYFRYYYNEEGYLDDIVLDYISPMYDVYGNYVVKKDSILMIDEKRIEKILSYILPRKYYNYFEGNAGYNPYSSPVFYENAINEIGMTDKFRIYYDSFKGEGLLPDKLYKSGHYGNENIYDILEIENININDRIAIAKVTLGDQNIIKYYDIHWTTDEEYRLDSLEVKFNREEILSVMNN